MTRAYRHGMTIAAPTPTVNGRRLLRNLDELAKFGADERGGVSRTGFSAADHDARRYLLRSARAAGLSSSVDPAGNVVVRRRVPYGRRPALLMGSHLDSVRYGGRLDGAYGVVAAIEVMRVLAGLNQQLHYEPAAVAFANEEGALFPQPFWGSSGLTGQLDEPAAATDRDGRSIREPLRAAGGDLDRVADAAWPAGSIGAYLELHVEQGPVLEHAGVPIGVVSAITGRTVLGVRVGGVQGHAGTTPMRLRRDAVTTAARIVLAVERLAADGRCEVATVGVMSVDPNVTNVIAGEVRLAAEIRDPVAPRLAAAEAAIRLEIQRIAEATGATCAVQTEMHVEPAGADPVLCRAIAESADELGFDHLVMPSGAGHDAQVVAKVAPIGMIFVPSRAGISHSPQEHTDDEDLVNGAEVLLHTALRLSAPGWADAGRRRADPGPLTGS